MNTYNHPITDLIKQRFSCRRYSNEPISSEQLQKLQDLMAELTFGPFGTPMRFDVVAADGLGGKALRSFGTYGFIHNPNGFVVGALNHSVHNLEEFGYRMEQIVLGATDLGLGTCWLGGTFMKGVFARKIGMQKGE
ncbi:MAG TPA: nitroreductase family protein, partial [Anaerolineaceae bacterium]|nr:nitroreductase family protein [Anaerolineaceae bacterium]